MEICAYHFSEEPPNLSWFKFNVTKLRNVQQLLVTWEEMFRKPSIVANKNHLYTVKQTVYV